MGSAAFARQDGVDDGVDVGNIHLAVLVHVAIGEIDVDAHHVSEPGPDTRALVQGECAGRHHQAGRAVDAAHKAVGIGHSGRHVAAAGDRGKACTLTSVAIRTNTDPELDDHPHGWKIASVPVNLEFREKDGDAGDADEAGDAPAVSKSVPKGWTEDFEAAKQQAAKEGKLILIDFSGSDWCGWCKRMDEEVFTKDRFVREASKKFVLVAIDSPSDKSILSALARKQNRELAVKYGVRGYPTVVIVDPDGKEVKRHSGYRSGGPNGYMKHLRELTRGVKWPNKSH